MAMGREQKATRMSAMTMGWDPNEMIAHTVPDVTLMNPSQLGTAPEVVDHPQVSPPRAEKPRNTSRRTRNANPTPAEPGA